MKHTHTEGFGSMTTVKRLSTTVAVSALAVASPLGSIEAALLYEPDSYVQDGLVLQLDGIRNVGANVPHDGSATVWANLAGGSGATKTAYTGTSKNTSGTGGWLDNAFYMDADWYFKTIGVIPASESVTVEVFGDFTPTQPTTYPNFISVADGGNNTDCGIWMNGGVLKWKLDSYGFTGSTRPTISSWDKKGFAAALDASQVVLYASGTTVSNTQERTSDKTFPACQWNIGCNYKAGDHPGKGTYYAVRIYTNTLTKAQIAANWQLDQYRFVTGIPETNVLITANIDGVGGDIGTGAFAVDENGYTFTFPASKTSGGNTYALSSCTVAEWDSAADDWSATETTQTIDANDGVSISIANTDKKRITLEWVGPPSFGETTVTGNADEGYTLSFTVASQPATSVTVYGTDLKTVLGTTNGNFAVGDSGTVSIPPFAGAQLLTATIANASGSTSASLGAFAGGAKLYAYDDFSGYTAEAAISGKSPSKTGFASTAWNEAYNQPLKAQSTDLDFPEFLAKTNLAGSVVRSAGYKTSAKRELDDTTVPYTGTFYYRFVFRQSEPSEGNSWCTYGSWNHGGNSLGFSATSDTSQDFYAIFNNHKTIGAGPMPDSTNSLIGVYLRTGWDKRTELVAPEDYKYDTDYLVCVEVTLSDSGNETFRAFAVKVADFTKSMISAPPWINCTDCSRDIVSPSEPFKWVTFATHGASNDDNATIVFDEFAMGPTLKDIFQRVAKPFVIIIR